MSASDMPFERLEALLRGDEPRTLEEKERASLLSELRAGELTAPDTLRETILATAPAVRRQRVRRPSRRLVLVVVPVAVALAVGAAIVHSFVGGSNNGPAALAALRPNARVDQHQGVQLSTAVSHRAAVGTASDTIAKTEKRVYAPATTNYGLDQAAGTPGFASGSADSRNAPLAGEAITIPKNRLVHADASMVVQVRSHAALQHATNNATQIIGKLGGYAQNVQYQVSKQGYGDAFLSLRVPVGKAQTALTQLSALGSLASEEIQTQDLQHQFNQQTNRIGSLQRAIKIYQQALASGSLTGTERVQIQIKLSNAEHTLTAVRKARSSTVAQGAMANISLTLTTNKHAIVGPGKHHNGSAFGRRLGDAAHFLGLEALYVLYALVLLSPFILLGGLAWWVTRERRRRDEKRLLAST